MVGFRTLKDIKLEGKRVLLRADYNLPVKDGKIEDDYRLKQSLLTIEYILKQKPECLIIISHLGRPEGKKNLELSLFPVAKRLAALLEKRVGFALDCIGTNTKKTAGSLRHGGIMLLENVRFHPGEEANDPDFAKQIVEASAADVFVQDGFGVVHRAHATTEAITKLLPSVGGLLLEKEVATIAAALAEPQRPLVAVVGGAKISDKIEVLNKFIQIADLVAVGGALANNFLVAEDIKVGKSVIDRDDIDLADQLLKKARTEERQRQFTFLVPVDGVVAKSMDGRTRTRLVDLASNSLADIEAYPKLPKAQAHHVAADELILDIGPISAAKIAGAINMAGTVIWSGTMGMAEVKGIAGAAAPFAHGTRIVAEAMIGASNQHQNKPFSLVGGGDTVAYIEDQKLVEDFNHVSTGGSASIELMAGKKLPGIEALQNK